MDFKRFNNDTYLLPPIKHLFGENERNERIDSFRVAFYEKLVPEAMEFEAAKHLEDWLVANGYFDTPASLSHHGTNNGGLCLHSFKVAEILENYTKKIGLKWQRDCSPWIVGLFHDLCKIDAYVRSEQLDIHDKARGWERYDKQLLTGHGEKSVMMLSRFMILTEEEILCIRYHMGAYETADWEQFDLAIREYPNVLYTHTADMAASKIFDI